jgi:hypothetical protein
VHHAVFGRLTLAPLIALLFVYNGELDCGVMNYIVGVGAALWAFATYIWLDARPLALRLLVGTAMVCVVFCCHFHALAIYGLAIFCYELARWEGWRTRTLLAVFAPFAIVPLLLAFGPHEMADTPIIWFAPRAKLVGAARIFESQMQWKLPDIIAGLIMIALVAVALFRGMLRVHRSGIVLTALSFVVFLIVPHSIFSATDVDVRLPCGVIFFILGLCTWHVSQRTFVSVLALMLAFRMLVVEKAWERHIAWTGELEQSFALIKPGSKILVSQADVPGAKRADELMYMVCDAVISRSSLVSLMFADPRQQLIRVNEPYREIAGGYNDDPIPVPDLFSPPPDVRAYWRTWREDYDYLYVISSYRNDPNPAADSLNKIYEGERFQLYAMRHAQAAR